MSLIHSLNCCPAASLAVPQAGLWMWSLMWIPVYVDSNSIAVFADVSLLIAVVPQTDFIYYKQNKKGQQNDAFPYYIFLSVFFPAFFFYHTLNFTICHLCKLVEKQAFHYSVTQPVFKGNETASSVVVILLVLWSPTTISCSVAWNSMVTWVLRWSCLSSLHWVSLSIPVITKNLPRQKHRRAREE